MKSSVATPPVMLEARVSELHVPVVFVIQGNAISGLFSAFQKLKERLEMIKEKGGNLREAEVKYFLENLPLLEKLLNTECAENSEMMAEAVKGYTRLNKRAQAIFDQARIDGNVRKAVETDYILDDLKCLKKVANQYNIAI